MEHPYLIVFLVAAALVIAAAALIVTRAAGETVREKERLRKSYGMNRTRGFRAEYLESLRKSAERSRTMFSLDNITWNDLQMDTLFGEAAHTVSSCGDECLYSMLRNPAGDREELRARIADCDFLDEREDVRITLQMMLSRAGGSAVKAPHEEICLLETASDTGRAPYVILACLTAAAVAGLFIRPVVSLICLIVLTVVNIAVYVRGDGLAKAELRALRRIISCLLTANRISGAHLPELPSGRLEALRMQTVKLRSLQNKCLFLSGTHSVSQGFLDVILSYLNVFFHLDRIIYAAVQKELRTRSGEISEMIRLLGILDASCAIASYRKSLPQYCMIQETDKIVIEAEELRHPLLHDPVPNSFSFFGGNIVTGSNASGKSTFLKSLALASVLGQGIGTVPALRFQAPFFRVMTSMALTDQLLLGESYFIVEIKSIRRMLLASKESAPLLCVIDEVLRGTNTIDRIAASSRILNGLLAKNVLFAAATHDRELAEILGKKCTNWHFDEDVKDGDVFFSYLLKKGSANTRNALRLLRTFDYPEEIVADAEEAAGEFVRTGRWQILDGI